MPSRASSPPVFIPKTLMIASSFALAADSTESEAAFEEYPVIDRVLSASTFVFIKAPLPMGANMYASSALFETEHRYFAGSTAYKEYPSRLSVTKDVSTVISKESLRKVYSTGTDIFGSSK